MRRWRGFYGKGVGGFDGGAGGGRAGECGVAVKSQMRGNCFESEQIWRSEIRADDGGSGGVIRIRACVEGWGV